MSSAETEVSSSDGGSITIVGPGGEESYAVGTAHGSLVQVVVEGSYTKLCRRNKDETDAAMQDRVQRVVNKTRVSHQPLHRQQAADVS